MTLTFDRWVRETIDERDLTGYARQRAREELEDDPTLQALWNAQHAADDRQSGFRSWEAGGPDEDLIGTLVDARRACGDALEQLADHVIAETVEAADVHGHTVDLRHARRLDCPDCSEDNVEAFYLGDAESEVGWLCGHCGATLGEDRETGNLRIADE